MSTAELDLLTGVGGEGAASKTVPTDPPPLVFTPCVITNLKCGQAPVTRLWMIEGG